MPKSPFDFLSWLHSLETFGTHLGLGRMRKLMKRLGNPERNLRFIHIAGTNGKGSVTAMAYSVLREAGFSVGMYTSPHLVRFNERIKVYDSLISDTDLAALAEEVYPFVQELRCTYFEATTAIALLYFQRKKADFVCFEVGLGGRLDATNVITPLVSIITNIGLEHTEYLGGTIRQIASEKAGIIKPRIPVVTGATGEALEVIFHVAARTHSPVISISGPSSYPTNLSGKFQKTNAALVVAAVRELQKLGIPVPEAALKKGLLKVHWPGRMDFVEKNILLDCAHNAHGIHVLHDELQLLHFRKFIFLIGVLKDKNYPLMLQELSRLPASFILTQPRTPRAAAPQDLAAVVKLLGGTTGHRPVACSLRSAPSLEQFDNWRIPPRGPSGGTTGHIDRWNSTGLKNVSYTIIPSVTDAFLQARSELGSDDLLVVTGSLYTVGEVYAQLEREGRTGNRKR